MNIFTSSPPASCSRLPLDLQGLAVLCTEVENTITACLLAGREVPVTADEFCKTMRQARLKSVQG